MSNQDENDDAIRLRERADRFVLSAPDGIEFLPTDIAGDERGDPSDKGDVSDQTSAE
jgi:hypothetical protein